MPAEIFIASKEGMEYDPRTLGALADVVDCDIRSALNTLQFVHSKGQKLTSTSINALAVDRAAALCAARGVAFATISTD